MYATQSNVIRHISRGNYKLLRELCHYSNNLFNVALYNIRQHFFRTKRFLSFKENYHICKTNENYSLLQAGVAQQILRVVDSCFKSFLALLKKAKAGAYDSKSVGIPHYREKGGMFQLVLSTNAINIKHGFLTVPTSRTFVKLHENPKIRIPFPPRLKSKNIKEVRILPLCKGCAFKIQFCYEQEVENRNLSREIILAIDVGLENLATCVTTIGTSFIMDGRKLKSINRQWNKEKTKLQSIANKQGQRTTQRLQHMTMKRNHRVNDILKKTARYIVNHCLTHDIGTIVCGYNMDFKRSINLGKVTNQQFTQISFGKLRETLANLCERYGMKYVEQEESYTSKASCLDKDEIPVYNPEQPYTGTFSGKRIKRGLYHFADGRIANADVNGAANILRKSKQNFDFEGLCRGLLTSPLRIRVA